MNSLSCINYDSPKSMSLPEESVQSKDAHQSEGIKEYSFAEICNIVQDFKKNKHDCFGHELTLAKNIEFEPKCNKKSCKQDTFNCGKELALLSCRHVVHSKCSKIGFFIGGRECPTCFENVFALEEYKDVNAFVNEIKLSCTHEGCYFTIQNSVLRSYSSDSLMYDLNRLLYEREQNLKEYIANAFMDIKSVFVEKIHKKGFLPSKERASIARDISLDVSVESDIRVIPKINIDKLKQTIAEANEVCPYPFANYKNKTLDVFLEENKDFMMDFIEKLIQEREYFSDNFTLTKESSSFDKPYEIYSKSPVTFLDDRIEISLANLCNIGSRDKEKLQYKYSDLNIKTTAAPVAFKKLITYLKTELAILDLIYEHKVSTICDYIKACIKPNWSAVDDFIIIVCDKKEVKISLSSFIDTDVGKANIDHLKQEMEKQGLNYQDLKKYIGPNY